MPLDVYVGHLLTPTSTGNLAVTGVGFKPKAVVFWGSLGKSDGTIEADLGVFVSFMRNTGISDAAIARGVSVTDDDGDATSDTYRTQDVNAAWKINDPASSTTLLRAIGVTIDNDGFTLNHTAVDASNQYRVNFLALGGSDIESVTLAANSAPSTNTTQTRSAGSGTLKLVFMAGHAANVSFSDSTTENAVLSFGMATGSAAGDQRAVSLAARDNLATMNTSGRQEQGVVLNPILATTNQPSRCSVSAWSTSSFDLTFQNSNATTPQYIWMAISGTFQAKIGTETSRQSTTGTRATTGVGFQPQALFTIGRLLGTNTAATDGAHLAIGGTDGTRTRGIAVCSEDNVADARANSLSTTSKLLTRIVETTLNSPAKLVEAELSSRDADGFTLNWTAVDATAREFFYLALAGANTTKTAAVAAAIGGFQASASLTFTKPTDTAAVSASVAAITAQASASFALSTYIASAGIVLAALEASATAAFTEPSFAASVDANLAPMAATASATFTKPTFAASVAAALAPLSAAANATFVKPTYAATVSAAIGAVQVAASCTFAKPIYTTNVAATLGRLTAAAVASVTQPTFTATIAAELPALELSANVDLATPTYAAAAALALAGLQASATVSFTKPTYATSVAAVMPAIDAAASTTFTPPMFGAMVSASLGPMSAAATVAFAKPTYTATVDATLGPVSSSALATFTKPTFAAAVALSIGAITAAVEVLQIAAFVDGPYKSAAWQFYVCGSYAGQACWPGSMARQSFAAGSVAGQAHYQRQASQTCAPGSDGGQSF